MKLTKLIRSNTVKKIVKKIGELNKQNEKINASIIIEHLPDEKDFILNHITKEMVDRDEKSSLKTLTSIVSSMEKKYLEEEYFIILQRYSNGEKLTDEEKKVLKSFKK